MALTGTLKDFGIAEILQLIGQQAKTGVLHLHGRGDEIHIAIADGSVVRAEAAGRKARERLGNMLVRAELLTPDALEHALDVQKRTLRRLGDVLVEEGLISKAALREMTALQTTETVYRLFHWKSGTYAFEPGEVEWDRETVTPLRAESVLMEGFRQVDEWPMIRKRTTATAMTFERLRSLDGAQPAAARGGDDVDAAFDALGDGPVERKGEFATLGANERRVHALAEPGRPVEKIVDLSRLGAEPLGDGLGILHVGAGAVHHLEPPALGAIQLLLHRAVRAHDHRRPVPHLADGVDGPDALLAEAGHRLRVVDDRAERHDGAGGVIGDLHHLVDGAANAPAEPSGLGDLHFHAAPYITPASALASLPLRGARPARSLPVVDVEVRVRCGAAVVSAT